MTVPLARPCGVGSAVRHSAPWGHAWQQAIGQQMICRQRRKHLEGFSANQRARLRRLNDHLAALELTILAEARSVDAQLRTRLSDPNDRLMDYEMEAVVLCLLRPEDRDYRMGATNQLARRRNDLKGIAADEPDSGLCCARLGDGVNHNEFAHWNHPLKGEHHCWIYHELYDHGWRTQAPDWNVGWRDLLRIGAVSWRLQIMQQYCPNCAPERHFWPDLPRGFDPLPRFCDPT